MSPGVTEVGQSIFDLHMIDPVDLRGDRRRRLRGDVLLDHLPPQIPRRGAAQFHESTKVEIAWTVVPFLILIGMAVPATSTLLDIYDFEDAEMDILITGYQWKWKYEYLAEDGENVSFFSNLSTPQSEIYNTAEKNENYLLEVDEPVVIPVNTKVRFLVTANDVIHSWWVPELAVKKDAIPGFINENLDHRRGRRHLPRPVCRAVRQGPRLHADRGQGREPGGIRGLDRRQAGRGGAGARAHGADLHHGRAHGARQERSTSATAWPATAPAARAAWARPSPAPRSPRASSAGT
jgi:hypothetical protein